MDTDTLIHNAQISHSLPSLRAACRHFKQHATQHADLSTQITALPPQSIHRIYERAYQQTLHTVDATTSHEMFLKCFTDHVSKAICNQHRTITADVKKLLEINANSKNIRKPFNFSNINKSPTNGGTS